MNYLSLNHPCPLKCLSSNKHHSAIKLPKKIMEQWRLIAIYKLQTSSGSRSISYKWQIRFHQYNVSESRYELVSNATSEVDKEDQDSVQTQVHIFIESLEKFSDKKVQNFNT